MAEKEDGPDTSSIRPISSLRSKFESLGKDQGAATHHSPVPPRQASPIITSLPHGRPSNTFESEGNHVLGMGPAATERSVSNVISTPLRPRPYTGGPRPTSMVSMSSAPHSPPIVTIDSPRSPHKTVSMDLRPSVISHVSPIDRSSPKRTDEVLGNNSRSITETTIPWLDTHVAPSARSSTSPSTSIAPTDWRAPSSAIPSAKSHFNKQPPAVNRAAKPKIPIKPPELTKKHNSLTAPSVSAEQSDRSVSPFSTPPSSGDSSPNVRNDPIGQTTPRPIQNSGTIGPLRSRNDSDASWVQRVRGESDASVVNRVRADSNASFVESSSLPEGWLPPPIHHSVAARRELASNGATTALTRHRNTLCGEDFPEDRPTLPVRPDLQLRNEHGNPPTPRSGRTGLLKNQLLQSGGSDEQLRRAAIHDKTSTAYLPPIQTEAKFALGPALDVASPRTLSTAPAVPPPRKSMERRREAPPPPTTLPSSLPATSLDFRDEEKDNLAQYGSNGDQVAAPAEYPDTTHSNRRAPRFKQRPYVVPTEYDTRLLALCGEYCCTSGYITKAWSVRTGEQLLHMEHRENIRVTSVVFKPSSKIEDEGKRIWLGTNAGEIHEVDIPSQSLVKSKVNAHDRREVIGMFRYASEIWTIDDGGGLNVWKPDHKGMPSLDSQNITWRIPKGITFSLAAGKHLWVVNGKDIRIFLPGCKYDSEFHVLRSALSLPGAGDITCGTTLTAKQDLVYFGHSDGKVSIYSRKDFSCKGVVNISMYKISSLAAVGETLWAGYSTGMAYVYDMSTQPWTVRKDWKAHEKRVCSIVADPSAVWKMGRLNVVTLGLDNLLRIWDGMLEDDWLETRMRQRVAEYSSFREVTASILTWNAGASKPNYLQQSEEDSTFLQNYLTAQDAPDIFVFGFQELVDLENKKATAKAFFKSKRKDPGEQEHMSHQYRAWRDHLTRCIDDHMPNDQSYTHLHTSSMVGLFTSVFVKSRLRQRIRHVHTSEVKRGMGGHHGNKGAIVLRMILDDSSICLVNCHLAAGQTQTMHRNNDIAAILEASDLPDNPLRGDETAKHTDVFTQGGDGSMIMDHEICILNGDLNYRIDTMGRDAVVKHVQQGNLAKLLERDQLLLSRKKNPGFRLRAFHEPPITFAPTYKYDVRSDAYDTSEKRRAPAWCDRILYRGSSGVAVSAVTMHDYRRWDQIRVSDHRPVSARLRLRVKTVQAEQREVVWDACAHEIVAVRQRIAHSAQLQYLTDVLGMSPKEAVAALQGGRK